MSVVAGGTRNRPAPRENRAPVPGSPRPPPNASTQKTPVVPAVPIAAQPGHQRAALGRPRQYRRRQPSPRPRPAGDAAAASDRMSDFAASLICPLGERGATICTKIPETAPIAVIPAEGTCLSMPAKYDAFRALLGLFSRCENEPGTLGWSAYHAGGETQLEDICRRAHGRGFDSRACCRCRRRIE